MAVQVSYPGVYIEEFTPAAPIQGVGTSTPAFIGVAETGPLDTPTKLTSWDRFRALFGERPVPGFFLWYAVRGFFENGGQVCYVVRASNGKYGKLTINTFSGAKPLFDVLSREPGALAISAETQRQHLLEKTKTSLFLPTGALVNPASAADKQVVLSAANAAKFRPGDTITLGALGERLQILRVTTGTPNSTLLLDKPLANPYAAAVPVRLANAPAGARTFRIAMTAPLPPQALVEGAMLTFEQAPNHDTQIVETVQIEQLGAGALSYRITLQQGIAFPIDMTKATTVESEEFTLTITQGAGSAPYPGLALDSLHPRHYLHVVNDNPDALVTLLPRSPAPAIPMPGNMPENKAATPLAGGAPENLTTLVDQDFIDAIDTLRPVDDVNMVSVPDQITPAVQDSTITHCQLQADRFAVLDCRPGLEPFEPAGLPAQLAQVPSPRGYAALYYPWLRVPPAGRGDLVLVPPSGHICGIFARSDNSRGVHKAPANEMVNGALGVERTLSDIDHGQLNLSGVNVIRLFQGGGRPLLLGARTTATDRNWQYVNIRRLFLYLEESIQEGIFWAVFEPNNLQLWQKLRRTITEFLTRVWRDGGLFGAKAEEAFYVRIDEALNPFSEQALGRLHIEIGVRPSYPAEFIIVRIGIWAGGSEVSEG